MGNYFMITQGSGFRWKEGLDSSVEDAHLEPSSFLSSVSHSGLCLFSDTQGLFAQSSYVWAFYRVNSAVVVATKRDLPFLLKMLKSVP